MLHHKIIQLNIGDFNIVVYENRNILIIKINIDIYKSGINYKFFFKIL